MQKKHINHEVDNQDKLKRQWGKNAVKKTYNFEIYDNVFLFIHIHFKYIISYKY